MIVMPLLILMIAALFLIRGYVLTQDTLLVQRLGWNSRLALTGLRSVEVDPQAMAKSIKTFGNGGLFCFAGAFRNKKLGAYRAFATDPKLCVILKYDKRTIIITPENPDHFVSTVSELRKL
jgi:hypothetical protein